MAPDANALSPALVDLALGPELANMAGNELGPTNEVDPATRAGTPTSGAEAADMEPAEEERTRQGRREEEPAEPEPVDTEPPADNSMEPESETTE